MSAACSFLGTFLSVCCKIEDTARNVFVIFPIKSLHSSTVARYTHISTKVSKTCLLM